MKLKTPPDIGVGIIIMLLGILSWVLTRSEFNAKIFLQTISYPIISVGITMIIYSAIWGSEQKLTKKLAECGIKQIFKDREEAAFEIEKLLKEVIKNGGEVKVLSIAATQFFEETGPFCYLIANIHNWKPKRHLTVKFVLINPFSPGATERMKIEECEPGDEACETKLENGPVATKLHTRWLLAYRWLSKYSQKTFDNIVLDYCLYDSSPVMYLIIINNELFIEQYHDGKIKAGEFIAGHMPIIQYTEKSEEYERCLNHFEYIWKFYKSQKSPRKLSVIVEK